MDDTPHEVVEEDELKRLLHLQPARFAADLRLPPADERLLEDAAVVVRREYHDCSKWKRLRCRKVSIVSERGRGNLCVLDVGGSVDFDWTWEGAIAFRPRSLEDNGAFSRAAYEEADYSEQILWQGEVLEVDERNGCLFVSLNNPEALPTSGSFFVRPFEFLSVLDAVYNDEEFAELRSDLPQRLAAAQGGVHPVVKVQRTVGLPCLQAWWQHTWNVLWGPPGTGKTWTTGQQIAAVLEDPTERILVVSTTNRATDAAALAVGNAARSMGIEGRDDGKLLRIGNGASIRSFTAVGLESMLQGTESEVLHEMDELAGQLQLFDTWEEKALIRKKIGELRSGGGDRSQSNFVDPAVRVVVATAFKATSYLRKQALNKMLKEGDTPFTTIFIDEAGLMSRLHIAVLSLLAARRVVLVGDSKQLAPISRISRVLPTRQQNWLASSGLSHLERLEDTPTAVHVLSEQRRMHPDVCRIVSDFQYGDFLTTAAETVQRDSQLATLLADYSRAIWYVLDAEGGELSAIRAQRGPGNKSWVRSITSRILERLFRDKELMQSNGLFISPYKAQAQQISKLFTAWGLTTWEASTVHSQQGAEADVVIFDTVNAGNYNWPVEEWKRLVNVALSRAREAVIVLASCSEMEEPYLRPLLRHLTPSLLIEGEQGLQWQAVERPVKFQPAKLQPAPRTLASNVSEDNLPYESKSVNASKPPTATKSAASCDLGTQLQQRKEMRPVLSKEQQRLSDLTLDGKPRLVRGVAGSGKSMVLCNWLAKTVKRRAGDSDLQIWAVYANRSLHKLLRESVESAWGGLTAGDLFAESSFPWEKVALLHVKDVLAGVLPTVALTMDDFEFDYDRAAEAFLHCDPPRELLPSCSALFIDEAQDMGPSTLKLLLSLVEQADAEEPNSRSAHIFYDSAQNVYGRKIPKWSEFGLDMRGRSTIMRESFRSTTPITELAVNVLHRLIPSDQRQDQNELMGLGLIEKSERNGEQWLRVRYNQVDGPKPSCLMSHRRDEEIEAIFSQLEHWIGVDGISPADISLIYNGTTFDQLLESQLGPRLKAMGVELSVQTKRAFERQSNTLVVSTPHSFKGYESEAVLIPCVDQFVAGEGQILANNLYVAMTRARSLLAIHGTLQGSFASRQLTETITKCVTLMNTTPAIELATSIQDDLNDILERIGNEHRQWLVDLWKRFEIRQEPLTDTRGQLVAEPLFWFDVGAERLACFDSHSPRPVLPKQLGERSFKTIGVGESVRTNA